MTQENIIELAQKAGLHLVGVEEYWAYTEVIEAFAKLIAAKEREACAKICEDLELPFVADAIHARKNK